MAGSNLLGVSVSPFKIFWLSTSFFMWFFLEFLRNFCKKSTNLTKFLVGISSARSQGHIRIIHPDHTECTYPLSLILTIEDPIGSDFGPPSEKTYENLYFDYKEWGGGSIDTVWIQWDAPLSVLAIYRSYSGPRGTWKLHSDQWFQLLGEEIFVETYSKSPYFADFEYGKNSSLKFFLSLRVQLMSSYSCFFSTWNIECVECFSSTIGSLFEEAWLYQDTRSTKSRKWSTSHITHPDSQFWPNTGSKLNFPAQGHISVVTVVLKSER